MNIALMEPFYSASHKQWCDGFIEHSSHHIDLFSMPGRHWKWRMHGGAISLAQRVLESHIDYEIFITSDFVDLCVFKALVSNKYPNARFIHYFHENQITYPWSPNDQDVALKRDNHYGFIGYSSALAADAVCFNSHYHRDSFLGALPGFLAQFPDYKTAELIPSIQKKSAVWPLGFQEAPPMDSQRVPNRILWNHRWEYDKNPQTFFEILFELDKADLDFELVVLGAQQARYPKIFDIAQHQLRKRIVHWGYAEDKEQYWSLLQSCDLLPVTSNQDFFGISVIEAMQVGVIPLLPNRLAYPEHLDSDHLYCLYEDRFGDGCMLLERLRDLLTSSLRPNRDAIRAQTEPYRWDKVIAYYDSEILHLAFPPNQDGKKAGVESM